MEPLDASCGDDAERGNLFDDDVEEETEHEEVKLAPSHTIAVGSPSGNDEH